MRDRDNYEETWRAIQELELEWEQWFKSDVCSCEGKCSQCMYFGVCRIRMELDSIVDFEGEYRVSIQEEWDRFLEDLLKAVEELAMSMTLQDKRELLQKIEKRREKYDQWVEWYFSNECGECEVCPYQDVCELPNYDKQDREADK